MAIAIDLTFLLVSLTAYPVVNGCGQLQPGQEKTVSFTVSGFKLPAVMVYSEDPLSRTKVSTISTSKSEAETFVRNLIMQPVKDILYQQGRSAFLSDSVISLILQQLEIRINYEPLNCENVVTQPMANANGAAMGKLNCIIIDDTVTSTCTDAGVGCMMAGIANNLKPVAEKYFSIFGSLKTSNVVMANWSVQMWASVLNRVLRRITSGPNGSFFYGAFVSLK